MSAVNGKDKCRCSEIEAHQQTETPSTVFVLPREESTTVKSASKATIAEDSGTMLVESSPTLDAGSLPSTSSHDASQLHLPPSCSAIKKVPTHGESCSSTPRPCSSSSQHMAINFCSQQSEVNNRDQERASSVGSLTSEEMDFTTTPSSEDSTPTLVQSDPSNPTAPALMYKGQSSPLRPACKKTEKDVASHCSPSANARQLRQPTSLKRSHNQNAQNAVQSFMNHNTDNKVKGTGNDSPRRESVQVEPAEPTTKKQKRLGVHDVLQPELSGRHRSLMLQVTRDKVSYSCVLRDRENTDEEDDIVALAKGLSVNEVMCKLRLRVADGMIRKRGACWLGFALTKYNRTIQELDLSGNYIGESGALILANVLAKNEVIRVLEVSCCQIPPKGVATMCKILEAINRGLVRLNLGGNNVSSGGAKYVSMMLTTNPVIADLDLSNTNILYPDAIRYLRAGVENSRSLKRLSLADNKPVASSLCDPNVPSIASIVERARNVTKVEISHNDVLTTSVTSLVQINPNLTFLGLGDIGLGKDAKRLQLLCLALCQHPSIEELDLRQNELEDEQATLIASILQSMLKLTKLDLSQNLIGAEGAQSIAQALQNNVTLRILCLKGNRIGDGGASAVASMMTRNSTLEELELESNSIGSHGGKALGFALRSNNALKILALAHNEISDAGGAAIGEALQENSGLREIRLNHNRTSDATAMAFAQAFQQNTVLARVSIRAHHLSGKLASDFVLAIHHSPSLRECNIMEGDNATANLDTPFFALMRDVIVENHLCTDIATTPEMRYYRYVNRIGFWRLLRDAPLGFFPTVIANLHRPSASCHHHTDDKDDCDCIEQYDLDAVFNLFRHRPAIANRHENDTGA